MHLRYSETDMRRTHLTDFLSIASIVYVILVVLVVVLTFRWTFGRNGSIDEATKLAAVWVSLLTALLAAVASISVAFVQRKNNEILAELQASAAWRLEGHKIQITAEQKAYDELCGAASYYYYAVKQIEYGLVEPTQTKTAENGMVAACRYLVALSDDDKAIWIQVWQRCRYMALEIALKDSDQRKQEYKTHIVGLDQYYEAFFAAARKHHLTGSSSDKYLVGHQVPTLSPETHTLIPDSKR